MTERVASIIFSEKGRLVRVPYFDFSENHSRVGGDEPCPYICVKDLELKIRWNRVYAPLIFGNEN